MELVTQLRLTGLLALLGAFFFAVGDVLLLAGKVNIDNYPKLRAHLKLLSGAERMAGLSSSRMMWGALLGVFGAPLVLVGFWQIYHGLSGANPSTVLAIVLLFGIASVVGAFVHGTFYFMGEYVQALNNVSDDSQSVIVAMIQRHKKVLIISYAPVLIMIIIASILFSILVAAGETHFPIWMAAVSPLTITIAWLVLKRFLPQFIRDWTEGAGFNIAYFVFFACTTLTLRNG